MISNKDKILFLNLDYGRKSTSVKDTMAGLGEVYSYSYKLSMPVMDFMWSATILDNNNYSVKVIDNELDKINHRKLIENIIREGYNIVFLRTSLPTLEKDLLFINNLKKSSGNVKVCIFAPHLSEFQGILNETKIDFFISGESEFAFLDLADQLPIPKIKGLGYRKEKQLVYNGDRGHNNDLNLLPIPKWDLVEYKNYSFITCSTSKGCPYNCTYCPYPVYQGLRWRTRDGERIINELKELYFKYKINFIRFRDPEFTMDRNRVIEICQGIIENKINILWQCETRLDQLDKELLTIMKKAGCERICFAIESINNETLKIVNRKKIDRKKIDDILDICAVLGIKASGFFIIGLPAETKKTTLELINFSLKLNNYLNSFTIATSYPGTRLHRWAKERNLLINENDFSLYTGRNVVMTNGILTIGQLKTLQRFANLANRKKRRKIHIQTHILEKSKKGPFPIKRILHYFIEDFLYYFYKIKIKFL